MEETDTKQFKALREQIKYLFKKRKSEQCGRPYKMGPRFRKTEIWDKIAKACMDENAYPDLWVECAFVYNKLSGGPWPTNLGTEKMKENYRNFIEESDVVKNNEEAEQYMENLLTRRKNSLKQICRGSGKPPVFILMMEAVGFEAFVRIILSEGHYRVKEKYKEEALKELESNPPIRDFIKNSHFKEYFNYE